MDIFFSVLVRHSQFMYYHCPLYITLLNLTKKGRKMNIWLQHVHTVYTLGCWINKYGDDPAETKQMLDSEWYHAFEKRQIINNVPDLCFRKNSLSCIISSLQKLFFNFTYFHCMNFTCIAIYVTQSPPHQSPCLIQYVYIYGDRMTRQICCLLCMHPRAPFY